MFDTIAVVGCITVAAIAFTKEVLKKPDGDLVANGQQQQNGPMLTSPRRSAIVWSGVLSVGSLRRLFDGWTFTTSSRPIPQCVGPIVSLRGDARSGKSTVRSLLLGHLDKKTPEGVMASPDQQPRLGAKAMQLDYCSIRGRSLAFLETTTFDDEHGDLNRGDACDDQFHRSLLSELPLCYLTDPTTVLEQFTRDVSFLLCDVFIQVVDGVGNTALERAQMAATCAALKEKPTLETKLIVIHNFKDVADEVRLREWTIETSKAFPWCESMSEAVDFNGETESIVFLDGCESPLQVGAELQQHFFIAQDNSPAGELNPWVMAKILSIILSLQIFRKSFDLKQRLEDSLNGALFKDLDNDDSCTKTQIDLESNPAKLRYLTV